MSVPALGVGDVLAACRDEGRAAFIAYYPVGFPTVEHSLRAMEVLVEGGVDIIEIGVPYTDPLMDGTVIQAAAATALANGFRVDDVFTATRAVRDLGVPPLIMSYWNLVRRRGVDTFARQLADAGGAGIITADLIPDEAAEWIAASDATGLDRIFLVAPSSTDERLATVTAACRGFVYAASTMGVTGTRSTVGGGAAELVRRTKAVTATPVCVGLGVSNRAQVAQVASFADGVIVGSALVRCLLEAGELDEGLRALRSLTEELTAGVREGRR